MKYLFLSFIVVLCFVSCKKDSPAIESINTNNSSDSLTYQPKNAGSKWFYTRVSNILSIATIDSFYFTSLNYDTTAYGSSFHVFKDDFLGNQYIRQDAGKYYTIITNSTNKPQILVLDTSKNLNEWWQGGVNGNDTYSYKIVERIPSYSLDNFTFRNVIKVYGERVQSSGGVNTITLKGDVYYAQGVGQIKSDLTGLILGNPASAAIKIRRLDLK
jgi:hypothetical protein